MFLTRYIQKKSLPIFFFINLGFGFSSAEIQGNYSSNSKIFFEENNQKVFSRKNTSLDEPQELEDQRGKPKTQVVNPFFCKLNGTELQKTENQLSVLYSRLDPTSISQHLAFYDLYQPHFLAQKALQEAWLLLSGSLQSVTPDFPHELPSSIDIIQSLIELVNKPVNQELVIMDERCLESLVNLSKSMPHSLLKGHYVWKEDQIADLPDEQIDLARALFVTQFGDDRQRILSYEALIDLMALQISVRLPKNASATDKIQQINAFIFGEMGFRFPPHSKSTKEVNIYSFLPSVLDSHQGVCLGVSILYLCIAQRLNLNLEMITPPGHIYVRYRSENQIINIETTARGIHLDCCEYLGIRIKSLQQRTIREVIGMAYWNQAAAFWQKRLYEDVVCSYRRAQPYMKNDQLLKELMGYALLITGEVEEGEKLLKEVKDHVPNYSLIKGTMIEDYLNKNVDIEGFKTIFSQPEEDRASILKKKDELEELHKRCPKFRAGLLHLAMVWMQLYRAGECIEVLKKLAVLDPSDPEVHFYLSALSAQRRDYPSAWLHLKTTEKITFAKNYSPKILKEFRRQLINYSPEPKSN